MPFLEAFSYNAFNDITMRETETWGGGYYFDTGSYTNHRRTGSGYDADGRVTTIDTRTYTYDAAGRNITLTGQKWTPSGYVSTTTESGFDADGNRVRENSGTSGSMTLRYYLLSTALGGAVVEELNGSGQKEMGYVLTPSGSELASQNAVLNYVQFRQRSPLNTTRRGVSSLGDTTRDEYDPVGARAKLSSSGPPDHGSGSGEITNGSSGSLDSRSSSMANPLSGCLWDGVPAPCELALRNRESYVVTDVDPFYAVSYRGRRMKAVWVGADTSYAVRGENEMTIYAGPGGYFEWVEDPDDVLELFTQPVLPQNTVTAPLGDLKGNLQKILNQKTASGTCEEYTTKLLAQAAKMFAGDYPHINSIMGGYDKITSPPKGGGYILKQYVYDTVDGDLFADRAHPGTVWLVPNRQYGSMSKQRIAEFQADYAWTALHETLHLGKQGGYSDEQLASAAYALARMKLPTTNLTGVDRAYFYSGRFDDELMKHCPKLQVDRR